MPPEEKTAPEGNVTPGVTMKAHQALEARIALLESEMKDMKEMVAKAKAWIDGAAAEKLVPKGYQNPFRL